MSQLSIPWCGHARTYSLSLSQASGIDSFDACWKFKIRPRRTLVLPVGKNFERNALAHLSQVSTAALLAKNHYFTLPKRENGNRRSRIASCDTPLITKV